MNKITTLYKKKKAFEKNAIKDLIKIIKKQKNI